MRNIPLSQPDGEILFAVGIVDVETIRKLCVEALAKDPQNKRILRVLRGVSPYDDALPPAKRKKL